MKRFILTLVAALALTLSLTGTSLAHPGHDRDAPNCVGKTAVFMAQRYHNTIQDAPGIGNDAAYLGETVKQLFDTRIVPHCNP